MSDDSKDSTTKPGTGPMESDEFVDAHAESIGSVMLNEGSESTLEEKIDSVSSHLAQINEQLSEITKILELVNEKTFADRSVSMFWLGIAAVCGSIIFFG